MVQGGPTLSLNRMTGACEKITFPVMNSSNFKKANGKNTIGFMFSFLRVKITLQKVNDAVSCKNAD